MKPEEKARRIATAMIPVSILLSIIAIMIMNKYTMLLPVIYEYDDCPMGIWSATNHCDAICYGTDKGVYGFTKDQIIYISKTEYICPCNTANVTVSETCV